VKAAGDDRPRALALAPAQRRSDDRAACRDAGQRNEDSEWVDPRWPGSLLLRHAASEARNARPGADAIGLVVEVSVVKRDRRAEGKACDDDTEQNSESGHHGS
jgi:hypothetical protein